jgi:hypothetical protein
MIDEMKRLERRTAQYWFEDGIWEMAFGALMLLMGIYLFSWLIIPRKPLGIALWGISAFPLLMICVWIVNRVIRSSKEKWTYPRLGFVSYQRQDVAKRGRRFSWRGGILGGVVGFASPFLKDLAGFSWFIMGGGVILGLSILYVALRISQTRFFLLSIIMLSAGTILATTRLDPAIGLAILYAIQGLFLIAAGRITFGRFVRNNPVREGNEP